MQRSSRTYSPAIFSAVMLVVQLASRYAVAAPGDLDPTFGSGGEVTTDITTGEDTAYAVVQQPDGKLVAAGRARLGTSFDFAVIRYESDGTLDPTFGGTGVVTTAIENGTDIVQGLVLQPDGKLVAAGWGFLVAHWHDFALVRYNPDGSLDPSWGADGTGKVTTNIGPDVKSDDAPYELIRQSDGKLVAAGETHDPVTQRTDVALVRYDEDGALDPTFGGTGVVVTPIGLGGSARGLVQQADGRLVVTGFSSTLDGTWLTVVRYDPDGSLDASFGDGGIVVTPLGGEQGAGGAIVEQADGALVVAGEVDHVAAGTRDVALVRYGSDGALDPGFGEGGIVVTPLGASSRARGLVMQGPTLVAAGTSSVGGSELFALVRYRTDGSLDPTFGQGGIVQTRVNVTSSAKALVQQPDGKLVAAGGSYLNGSGCFGLARYEGGLVDDPTTTSSTSSTSTTTVTTTTTTSTTGVPSSTTTSAPSPSSTTSTSSTSTTSDTAPSTSSSTVTSTTVSAATSTTLGCTADRLTCICRGGLDVPECAGQLVPRSIPRRYAEACRAVEKLSTAAPGRATRLERTASRKLATVRALARRAGRRKISPACAGAIVARCA